MMWFNGNIAQAISKSKAERKVFLVFVEGDDDISKNSNAMYEETADRLENKQIVAIKLRAGTENCRHFSQIYPVLVIPSTFLIGNDGVPLEIVAGPLPTEEFLAKIDKSLELHEKRLQENVQETSADGTGEKGAATGKESQSSASQSDQAEGGEASGGPLSGQPVAETQDELNKRLDKAQAILEELRVKKAKAEEETEKQQEIERRKVGKDVLKAKQLREENEMKETIKEREKDKMMEKAARERVLAQIASDRAERKARSETQQEPKEASPQATSSPGPSSASTANYDSTRIQFRLPDGSSITHQFEATTSLREAREYLMAKSSYRKFNLATAYPRRTFCDNDYDSSLRDLELVPSSVLLVILTTSGGSSVGSVVGRDWITEIGTILLTPFIAIYTFIIGLFAGSTSANPTSNAPQRPTQSGPSSEAGSSGARPKGGSGATTGQRRPTDPPTSRYEQDGNVARLRTRREDEDDDDNNTWNGNSTQQM